MKKNVLLGLLVILLALGVSNCDNNTNNTTTDDEPVDFNPNVITYTSEDIDGNLYTLEITESSPQKSIRYAIKQGDSFKLTIEFCNEGYYSLALIYSGIINSTLKNNAETKIDINIDGWSLTITIIGTEMKFMNGFIPDVEKIPEELIPIIDKSTLNSAIIAANALIESTLVSVNGTDVSKDKNWVTQAQMDTFLSAIITAQTFYEEEDSNQLMVNSARITLVAATNVFINQIKLGIKENNLLPNMGNPYLGNVLNISAQVYNKKTNLPFLQNLFIEELNDINGTANITKGKLYLNISSPSPLKSITNFFTGWHTNYNYSDTSVQAAKLWDGMISENNYNFSWLERRRDRDSPWLYENVSYIFVNKDVTISAKGKDTNYGGGAKTTSLDFSLDLKQGWNAVYFRFAETSAITDECTYILGNPDEIRWMIY